MLFLDFLKWAATQGFKHRKFLEKAYNSFKGKFPGKEVVLKTARNLYDDLIKKTPTKKITDKIRQNIKKDKLPIPEEFNKFVPNLVKKDKILDFTVPLRNKVSKEFVKKWNKAIPPEQMKIIIEKLEKILPKVIKSKKPSNIIPFPKKPPGKAEGGIAGLKNGGSSQKEIDKGIAAIEKLKPSLMPESYKALIELYKKKQKEVDMDIMESAGGLGEMLGEGGRIGFANGTTMDLQYINPGFDTSEGMLSGVGGFPFVPAAGLGILALSQKDKDKKKQPPQKTGGPNFPEPKPPFKIGEAIIDFILANRRQPKPSEEGQLKEILRVAKEKFSAPQKLLEDKVTIDDKTYLRSDKTRPPTEEELEDDYAELWNEEQSPWDFGSTIEELDAALKEQHDYHDYMYDQYKTGKLEPKAGEHSRGRLELLRERADSAYGDPKMFTHDDYDELEYLEDHFKQVDKEEAFLSREAEEIARGKASGSPWFTETPTPEEELRKEFPGLNDKLIKQILTDKNPQRIADVKQSMREALKMQEKGISLDDIIKTFKDTSRKKNAAGGIIGLAEGGPPSILNPPSKPRRKYFTKKTYPPGASSAAKRHEDQRLWERRKADEAFEGIWAGAPPSMKEREKMYRVQRTARMMEEDRIEAFEKKMYDRRKLYPYAEMTEKEFAKAHPKVYDMMKKDPAWNWEIFKTISFANPGETFQATGASEIEPAVPLGMWSTSGRHDPGELELFMTPFGQTNYEMSSEGPFNKNKIMSDEDKASVAIHEMRHKKILQDEELTAAQAPLAVEDIAWRSRDPSDYPIPTIDDIPEMVEPKAPPEYRHLNPSGSENEFSSPLSMHEVFNRFLNRQYSPLTTPSGPYFDKIWRDEWQPYADKYEKILKKRKDPEEGLRVLGNEGGIARRPNAVPPLSGPTPQGLTFLLGDDIVKNRIT